MAQRQRNGGGVSGGNQGKGDAAGRAADRAIGQRVGITSLLTGCAISAFLFWKNHLDPPMNFQEYNLLNTAFVLWLPLVVVLLGLRREPSEFGFTVGDTARGLPLVAIAFLLFIPVIVYIAPQNASQDYYLYWLGRSGSNVVRGIWLTPTGYTTGSFDGLQFAYHEIVMGFYMFGWEWFFRGFLLFGLRRWVPVWAAVLIQAVLFTALHWGKPMPEVISSFPGAILMALLALRSRSFVPCFVLHWLISAGFDSAVLYSHFHR